MLRFICLFALALLTTPFTCAAESKLPADAAKLVEVFDTDAAKIRADAEKAVDKRAAELTAKLQKAQDAAMKRGDLDGANAIKAAIEKAGGKEPLAEAKSTNKAPAHDDTGGRYVVLYNEVDYGGTKVKVPVPTDISQVTTLGFPNDALRSIQVPVGVVVKLYDSDMGGGAETTITESTSDLTPITHAGTTSLSAKKAK